MTSKIENNDTRILALEIISLKDAMFPLRNIEDDADLSKIAYKTNKPNENKIEKVLSFEEYCDNCFNGSEFGCESSSRSTCRRHYRITRNEIEQLKERIKELESDNEELRHILRNNV